MVRRFIGSLLGAFSLLAALHACGRSPRREGPGGTSIVSAPGAATSVATPPGLSSVADVRIGQDYVSSSVASFDGDRLVACSDVVITRHSFGQMLADGVDAGQADAGTTLQNLVDDDIRGFFAWRYTLFSRVIIDAFGKGITSALIPKGEPTTVQKPCRQQFSSRPIVAACAISARVVSDAGVTWQFGSEFIHFGALSDDRAMKGCLAAKGDWAEPPKNSAELLHESRAQLFRRLLKDAPQ